jgi:sporulation protein YunB
MYLKKRRKKSKFSKVLIILVIAIIIAIYILFYINNKVKPYLLDYAELETKKMANLVINRAVSKQLIKGLDTEKLFNIIQDSSGQIQSVDFNSTIVNQVLNSVCNLVQLNLRAVERGRIDSINSYQDIFVDYDIENLKQGIIYEIPFFAATHNTFLSNIGPKIPIRLNLVGNVNGNIKTNVEPYGINNAMIEILVHVSVEEQVILPFSSKKITIENDIPVTLKLIQGTVPKYYQNGLSSSSPIFSLPLE